MSTWTTILLAGALALGLKVAGYLVPQRLLEGRVISSMVALLPIALLAGLVAVQTFSTGQRLTLDARVVALGVALIALRLRAPFIVVVVLAAASAAGLRALGWG